MQGATVLQKTNDGGSLEALEKFEVVPSTEVHRVWDALLSQEGVCIETLNEYMVTASSIWALSGGKNFSSHVTESLNDEDNMPDRELTSVAWKSWISTFLLRDPKLRGS